MIVGTAGHIDHGKTALVKALTGVDADRLREEKKRGLTIDLGYAYQPLAGGDVLGFVDVPGHERFVHNMLAGVTGIDYVLLVVAADDGIMPQTREHLAILQLLGLSRGVVALTKTDLVNNERIAEVSAQIYALLADTPLVDAPLIPLSSVTGDGVTALHKHLCAAASALPNRAADGHFRLAVDRCFTLAGTGVVTTGTVFSGHVRVGGRLVVSPSGLPVRVRSIHAQNQVSDSGRAGQRCALNLAGAQLKKADIRRGDWILAEPAHAPTARLDARLRLLAGESRALRHWTPVHVHLGASDVSGRVAVLEGEHIEPGNSGLVQLVLDAPIAALRGDRFIVRDQSATRTVGGGQILDPFPPARGRRKPQRIETLTALQQSTPALALRDLLTRHGPAGLELGWFTRLWNLTPEAAEALYRNADLVSLKAEDKTIAFATERWKALLDDTMRALYTYHERHPNRAGATADELHKSFPQTVAPPIFTAAVQALLADQRLLRTGPLLQRPGFDARLSVIERRLWERVRPILREAACKPPRVRDLAGRLRVDEKQLRTLLRRLAERGELHQVSNELYFSTDAIAQLAAATQRLFEVRSDGTLTVKEFREHTGIGRNVVFEVLEFFDRAGFTLRVKDGRRLRQHYALVFGENKMPALGSEEGMRPPVGRPGFKPGKGR